MLNRWSIGLALGVYLGGFVLMQSGNSTGLLLGDLALPATSPPPVVLTKTVGTDPQICANSDEIAVTSGSNVYYCYSIENTSEITFDLHSLEDSELGPILTDFPFSLAPAASVFVTAEMKVSSDVVNTATWTVTDMDTETVFSAVDSATVTAVPPIVLRKTVGTDPQICATSDEVAVMPGSNVYFCYMIENLSDSTFDLHNLEDSELGPILTDFPFSLAPAASVFVTAELTVSTDVVNTATWTVRESGSEATFSAVDAATVNLILPTPTPTNTPTSTSPSTPTPTLTPIPVSDLEISKIGFPDPVNVGEALIFSVTITNHGPDAATEVVLQDTLPDSAEFLSASPGCLHDSGEIVCELSILAASEVKSVTIQTSILSDSNLCNHVRVGSAAVDPNPLNNSALACAVGVPFTPTPTTTPRATQIPTPVMSFHPADINEDRNIDPKDVLELLSAWRIELK